MTSATFYYTTCRRSTKWRRAESWTSVNGQCAAWGPLIFRSRRTAATVASLLVNMRTISQKIGRSLLDSAICLFSESWWFGRSSIKSCCRRWPQCDLKPHSDWMNVFKDHIKGPKTVVDIFNIKLTAVSGKVLTSFLCPSTLEDVLQFSYLWVLIGDLIGIIELLHAWVLLTSQVPSVLSNLFCKVRIDKVDLTAVSGSHPVKTCKIVIYYL